MLPDRPRSIECGIVNLDAAECPGTHWVCYAKTKDKRRIYFDSFGQNVLIEIMKYLKTDKEFKNKVPAIARNTNIVQSTNTHVCGHLCLSVLTSLMREHLPYQQVLNTLQNAGYSQAHR